MTELTAADRCGAQALHRVTIPGAGELLFCGHHYREHERHLPTSEQAPA